MKTKVFSIIFLAFALLYGCNGWFGNEDAGEKSAKVTVGLTDAPFPHDAVEQVNISVDWIKFKLAEDGEDDSQETDDSGGSDDNSEYIKLEVNQTFNLLELGNGKTEILGEVEIPAGEYREIRMHVTSAKIKLKDVAEEMDIKIPSGSSSGLKIKLTPNLLITEGEEYQIILDFDVSRSFLSKGKGKDGKITGFMFKPVIRATNVANSGSLSGTVKEKEKENSMIKNAHIYVLSPADVKDTIATGKTDKDGFYKIIGIPAGQYNVNCEKEEFATASKTAVEIKVLETTELNFQLSKTE